MKRNLIKLIALTTITSLAVSLAGCSNPFNLNDEDDPLKNLMALDDTKSLLEDEDDNLLATDEESEGDNVALQVFTTEGLESGNFYIRHKNNSCEPLYLGEVTFEGVANTPDNSRVCWFKEDFENIPTLYEGESLILYSETAFEEKFTLERFEDLGYTIGIRGIEISDAGHYKVSTQTEDKCTYPGGDTDDLLQTSNQYVILQKINGSELKLEPGTKLEDVVDDLEINKTAGEDETKKVNSKQSGLTRCGTLALSPFTKYEVVSFDGTIKSTHKYVSDVHVFGSMEIQTTLDFTYEDTNVIKINLPAYYNEGYYVINGVGMFRYLKNNYSEEEFINSPELFNIPNAIESDLLASDDGMTSITEERTITTPEEYENMSESEKREDVGTNMKKTTSTPTEGVKSTFEVTEPGEITIHVKYMKPEGLVGDGLSEVTARCKSPEGIIYRLTNISDTESELTINATELGEYVITYSNLDVRTPYVNVY